MRGRGRGNGRRIAAAESPDPICPNRGKRIVIAFHVSPRMWVELHELSLARWARQYLKPGGVAYDIGAHVGYTSLLFSSLLKGGSVHAFELVSSTAEYCRETMRVNNITTVHSTMSASARHAQNSCFRSLLTLWGVWRDQLGLPLAPRRSARGSFGSVHRRKPVATADIHESGY